MTALRGRRADVIGGGIAGLTTALALARQGASVCVYERADALTEVGAGLQITPNGARVLDALGLGVAVAERGIAAEYIAPMNGLSGRQLTRFDVSRHIPRYTFMHRADLIAILAEACEKAGIVLKLGDATEFATLGSDADLKVGAEGLRSQTRVMINGEAQAKFTGQVAWRAIVPGDDAPAARIWMAPDQHVVTYPLAGGRMNVVAVEERSDWADEGWSHAGEPTELQSRFSQMAPQVRALLSKADKVGVWGLHLHPVAANFHDQNMVLVGDAAHPTLPFLAQGANLALEDAMVLAECCSTDGIAQGLQNYQAQRRPRVQRAINAARANAANYHLSGFRRTAAATALRALGIIAPELFLKRMSWLYDFDVTAVSASAAYRARS